MFELFIVLMAVINTALYVVIALPKETASKTKWAWSLVATQFFFGISGGFGMAGDEPGRQPISGWLAVLPLIAPFTLGIWISSLINKQSSSSVGNS